jgi:hypothetical protein
MNFELFMDFLAYFVAVAFQMQLICQLFFDKICYMLYVYIYTTNDTCHVRPSKIYTSRPLVRFWPKLAQMVTKVGIFRLKGLFNKWSLWKNHLITYVRADLWSHGELLLSLNVLKIVFFTHFPVCSRPAASMRAHVTAARARLKVYIRG